MKILNIAATCGALMSVMWAGSLSAQTLAIGTGSQGAQTYSVGSAIANVAVEKGDIRMVVQPHGSTGKVAPLVNSGRLDFGLANILETGNAINGKGPFKDRAQDNLRVVGVIYPFRVGLFVRSDSEATNITEIKGKSISSEYSGHRIIKILNTALLANGGLSYDDMKGVPTVNLIGNADNFTEGQTEVGFFALGSGKVAQMNAAVGGLRFLSLDDSDAAVARMKAVLAPAYLDLVEPREDLVGIVGPTKVMAYNYLIYAGTHVSDDDVYAITKLIAENGAALSEIRSTFKDLDPAAMPKAGNLPFHSGAIKYYTEQGLWSR